MGRGGKENGNGKSKLTLEEIARLAASLPLEGQNNAKRNRLEVTIDHQRVLAGQLWLVRTGGKETSTPEQERLDFARAGKLLKSNEFTPKMFEIIDDEVRRRRRAAEGLNQKPSTKAELLQLRRGPLELRDWDDMQLSDNS